MGFRNKINCFRIRKSENMIKLGKSQFLTVATIKDFGVYLEDGNDKENVGRREQQVLLPAKQVPEGTKVGDRIRVFVYKDSEDRLISTTNKPKVEVGGLAVLEVKEVAKIGAFLDIGLERDILLPYREQVVRVKPGNKYLVALYVDKTNRLAATMKVYKYLKIAGDYEKDDEVSGIIIQITEPIGAFVAIDNEYYGIIPWREVGRNLQVGMEVLGRVTNVREDGKINMSILEKAYLRLDKDGEAILKVIEEYDGILPYNDRVSPEIIARDFDMSKAAFKRGVGHLLKAGKIEINEKSIKIIK